MVTTGLVVFAVPVFASIYSGMNAKLPAPTQILVNASDFIRGEWYVALMGAAAVIFAIKAFFKSMFGNRLYDRLRIKAPIFGALAHKICLVRFTGTYAQLLRSGVPVLEILKVVGDTAGNCVIQDAVKVVAFDIEQGSSLSNALAKHPVFPPQLIQMVGSGEETGRIAEMFDKLSSSWNMRVETALNGLASMIEPLMMVLIGGLVGSIMIALYMPIFGMSDALFSH